MQTTLPIGRAQSVLLDLTSTHEYRQLVAQELAHFDQIPVTDGLTEGGIHDHKSWCFYFDYLYSKHFGMSFQDAVISALRGRESPRVLSLGCGYGGHDLQIARQYPGIGELVAVDLNPRVYDAASRRAAEEGLPIKFHALDLNCVEIQPGYFDVIYAVASIHHILNLEHLFAQLERGLKPDGRLIIFEVIGKTQVEFWRENVEYAAGVVKRLARRYRLSSGRFPLGRLFFDPYKFIPRYVEPADQNGMEGIRQEEIAPLLDQCFKPETVFYFDAFMRLLCTNPVLGPLIDPDKHDDRRFLESLIDEEMDLIATAKLRPTEVFGIYSPKGCVTRELHSRAFSRLRSAWGVT